MACSREALLSTVSRLSAALNRPSHLSSHPALEALLMKLCWCLPLPLPPTHKKTDAQITSLIVLPPKYARDLSAPAQATIISINSTPGRLRFVHFAPLESACFLCDARNQTQLSCTVRQAFHPQSHIPHPKSSLLGSQSKTECIQSLSSQSTELPKAGISICLSSTHSES